MCKEIKILDIYSIDIIIIKKRLKEGQMDDYGRVNKENGCGVVWGGCSLIVTVIISIFLFGTEKNDLKGEPNYCLVKNSATQD
jgi:hypothetical protein